MTDFEIIRRNGQRHVVLIDNEDAERVLRFGRWSVSGNGYVVYSNHRRGVKYTLLHRFVMGAKPGDPQVDHKNGVRTDCRKSNLRWCEDDYDNYRNLAEKKDRGYRGVQQRPGGRWTARQTIKGKQFYLGTFDTEIEAANAVREFRQSSSLRWY